MAYNTNISRITLQSGVSSRSFDKLQLVRETRNHTRSSRALERSSTIDDQGSVGSGNYISLDLRERKSLRGLRGRKSAKRQSNKKTTLERLPMTLEDGDISEPNVSILPLRPLRPTNAFNRRDKGITNEYSTDEKKLKQRENFKGTTSSYNKGSLKRYKRAKSVASSFSLQVKSLFGGSYETDEETNEILLEGIIFLCSKVKKKWQWNERYIRLYSDRIEVFRSEESKIKKIFKLNGDLFVSFIEETGQNRRFEYAYNERDQLSDEETSTLKYINEELQQNLTLFNEENGFVIASFNSKIKKSIFLSCSDTETRDKWIGKLTETIEELRRKMEFGETKKFLSMGWRNRKMKNRKSAKRIKRNNKLTMSVIEDTESLDERLSKQMADSRDEFVQFWGSSSERLRPVLKKKNKKKGPERFSSEEFLEFWRNRESDRIMFKNQKLALQLEKRQAELLKMKKQKEQELEAVRLDGKKLVDKERAKNVTLKTNYDELLAKFRAEAQARNDQQNETEAKLRNRIKELEVGGIPQSKEGKQAFKELQRYKQKLETLEKAMKIDLTELDWDGTTEQAEERMQECLKIILEGDTPQVKAKAQKDFDKWVKLFGKADSRKAEEEMWKQWEKKNRKYNLLARNEMREKFVPKEYIQGCSVEMLMALKGLNLRLARRISRNKIFRFLWMDKASIAKLHAASLTSEYTPQGLDIRELRAIYACLPDEFEVDTDGRKKRYRDTIRVKLYNYTEKFKKGTLTPRETLHDDYKNIPSPVVRKKWQRPKSKEEAFDPTQLKWQKYRDMAKIFPDAVIKRKMKLNGDNPDLWERIKNSKSTLNEEVEEFDPLDPKWRQYRKMRKVLPDTVIKQNMLMNGDDPDLWDKIKLDDTERSVVSSIDTSFEDFRKPSVVPKSVFKEESIDDLPTTKEDKTIIWNNFFDEMEKEKEKPAVLRKVKLNESFNATWNKSSTSVISARRQNKKMDFGIQSRNRRSKVRRRINNGTLKKDKKEALKRVGTATSNDESYIQQIVDFIRSEGELEEGENKAVTFGTIFTNFMEISDAIPALLLKGKSTGHVDFRGEKLVFGIHDEVMISVYRNELFDFPVNQVIRSKKTRMSMISFSPEKIFGDTEPKVGVQFDMQRAMTLRRTKLKRDTNVATAKTFEAKARRIKNTGGSMLLEDTERLKELFEVDSDNEQEEDESEYSSEEESDDNESNIEKEEKIITKVTDISKGIQNKPQVKANKIEQDNNNRLEKTSILQSEIREDEQVIDYPVADDKLDVDLVSVSEKPEVVSTDKLEKKTENDEESLQAKVKRFLEELDLDDSDMSEEDIDESNSSGLKWTPELAGNYKF